MEFKLKIDKRFELDEKGESKLLKNLYNLINNIDDLDDSVFCSILSNTYDLNFYYEDYLNIAYLILECDNPEEMIIKTNIKYPELINLRDLIFLNIYKCRARIFVTPGFSTDEDYEYSYEELKELFYRGNILICDLFIDNNSNKEYDIKNLHKYQDEIKSLYALEYLDLKLLGRNKNKYTKIIVEYIKNSLLMDINQLEEEYKALANNNEKYILKLEKAQSIIR